MTPPERARRSAPNSPTPGSVLDAQARAVAMAESQEALVRTQLQQLGLEVADEAMTSPYRERGARDGFGTPSMPSWPSPNPGVLRHTPQAPSWDAATAARLTSPRSPGALGTPRAVPRRGAAAMSPLAARPASGCFEPIDPPADLNAAFRFPSTQPSYAPHGMATTAAAAAPAPAPWGAAVLAPAPPVEGVPRPLAWPAPLAEHGSPTPLRTARRVRSDMMGGSLDTAAGMWPRSLRPAAAAAPPPPRDVPSHGMQQTPNFSFPPRPVERGGADGRPPVLPMSAVPGAGGARRPPASSDLLPPAEAAPALSATPSSQQLTAALAPAYLAAGGGLLGPGSASLPGWGEGNELESVPERGGARATRHARSSSASAVAWSGASAGEVRVTLPQAQAQLAALHRSRQQMGPAAHGRSHSQSHARSASTGSAHGAPPRRALFGSYLPQSSLPLLLLAGQLVVGVLRVNQRNRSDAWVTTEVLGHDVFISGSKDRNRALEGDVVAIELLDPQEVWQTKRDKVDKKKRKEHRQSGSVSLAAGRAPSPTRRYDKARDDMEVEGAQLTLVEDEEESEARPPALAGHVVAVVERQPGQLFPGTLALLRPSSAATKERQAHDDDETPGAPSPRPKIIWFRPSDKRVPLIAIPSDQAPPGFWAEAGADTSKTLYVACMKRWPITSLHPFGSLVDCLGTIGTLAAESRALLSAHCPAAAQAWPDHVLHDVASGHESVPPAERASRRHVVAWTADDVAQAVGGAGDVLWTDVDGATTPGPAPVCAQPTTRAYSFACRSDGGVDVGIHLPDVGYFVPSHSAVDREARRRGAAVSLVEARYGLWPPALEARMALARGTERLAISVVFTLQDGEVRDVWLGETLVQVAKDGALDQPAYAVAAAWAASLQTARWQRGALWRPRRELQFRLDDDGRPTHIACTARGAGEPSELAGGHDVGSVLRELDVRANEAVAHRLAAALPDSALLQRQAMPSERAMGPVRDACAALGLPPSADAASLARALPGLRDTAGGAGGATVLRQALPPPRLYVPSLVDVSRYAHAGTGVPLYASAMSPLTRYGDAYVVRELGSVLRGAEVARSDGLPRDASELSPPARFALHCDTLSRTALMASRQSTHLYLCHWLHERAKHALDAREAIVTAVSETAVDVYVPSLALEKRLPLDAWPLEQRRWDAAAVPARVYLEWGATPPMAWLAQSLHDSQCGALYARHEAQLQREWPPAEASMCLQPMSTLRVYVVADLERSPPLLKLVVAP